MEDDFERSCGVGFVTRADFIRSDGISDAACLTVWAAMVRNQVYAAGMKVMTGETLYIEQHPRQSPTWVGRYAQIVEQSKKHD